MASKIKILIVEDEFISRTLLQEMLAPFGDCDSACNGLEAVEILERSYRIPQGRYDLVCLDIMLPKMNGHEVLQKMRRIEKDIGMNGTEITKVLMVTALNDSKNIMDALVVGKCEGYLTKPVSRVRLVEQLHHMRLIDSVI